MIVVADAGPLRYLVVIGVVDVLQPLYDRVLVPEAVAAELQEGKTPEMVRSWIAQPPICVRSAPTHPPTERWTFSTQANEQPLTSLFDRLLIDDWNALAEAERRQLQVTGTLGVLADAHLTGLLDFEQPWGNSAPQTSTSLTH